MLAEKKYNEVDNLIHYLKDNRDLEIEFKKILKSESEFMNILFFIHAFWNNSVKSKKSNNDMTSFNILIEIFNIFLKENPFFTKLCKRSPCLLNLINLISIRYAKIIKNFEKVKNLIEFIIDNFYEKINKRLLCESLRNEGFLNESFYYSSILNIQLNFGTNMEINEIERIFRNFNMNLNDNPNDDSIRFSNISKNINDDNFINNENDKFWETPVLLNNKSILKNKNSDKSLYYVQNNLPFLYDSNQNKNKTAKKLKINDNLTKNFVSKCDSFINKDLKSNFKNTIRNFNLKNKNIYSDNFSGILDPIKIPTQINMKDV